MEGWDLSFVAISWVGTLHPYDARGCAMLECHAGVCLTGAGEACGFHGYAIGWNCAAKIRIVKIVKSAVKSAVSGNFADS
jgi:hypothetical protein